MKNIGLDNARKAGIDAQQSSRPSCLGKCSFVPSLQEVHRWRYKDDERAHTPVRVSYNYVKIIQ
jgi:hypothetical protein